MHTVLLHSAGHKINHKWGIRLIAENGRFPGSWVIWGSDDGLTVAAGIREKMVLLENSIVGKSFEERVLIDPIVICPQRGDIFACPTDGVPGNGQFGKYLRITSGGSGRLTGMITSPRWEAVAVIIGDATLVPIEGYPYNLWFHPVQVI